jgi:uncharacterized membrane protein YphA (DoxX/SURF4 family)
VSSTGVGYAAAVALAAIFAIAAVAKLRDVSATERDFVGLGLPRASFFARFVPIAELSIVALLLIVPPAGAIAALVSLAFFTTFLIGRLRAGVRAPCACFGSSRAQPISVRDVIRNLLLMALAVVSLATDRPTAITPLDALAVLAVTAVAGGALHLAGRVRSR